MIVKAMFIYWRKHLKLQLSKYLCLYTHIHIHAYTLTCIYTHTHLCSYYSRNKNTEYPEIYFSRYVYVFNFIFYKIGVLPYIILFSNLAFKKILTLVCRCSNNQNYLDSILFYGCTKIYSISPLLWAFYLFPFFTIVIVYDEQPYS